MNLEQTVRNTAPNTWMSSTRYTWNTQEKMLTSYVILFNSKEEATTFLTTMKFALPKCTLMILCVP